MKNNVINNMSYDYYSNTPSYVKMILETLPESMVSPKKKQVVQELYNYFLNRYDNEKIKEITKISSLFREKISLSSLEETINFMKIIYNNYIDRIVFDSANRETVFNILNDNMKVYVGYFSAYKRDNISEGINEIRYMR